MAPLDHHACITDLNSSDPERGSDPYAADIAILILGFVFSIRICIIAYISAACSFSKQSMVYEHTFIVGIIYQKYPICQLRKSQSILQKFKRFWKAHSRSINYIYDSRKRNSKLRTFPRSSQRYGYWIFISASLAFSWGQKLNRSNICVHNLLSSQQNVFCFQQCVSEAAKENSNTTITISKAFDSHGGIFQNVHETRTRSMSSEGF